MSLLPLAAILRQRDAIKARLKKLGATPKLSMSARPRELYLMYQLPYGRSDEKQRQSLNAWFTSIGVAHKPTLQGIVVAFPDLRDRRADVVAERLGLHSDKYAKTVLIGDALQRAFVGGSDERVDEILTALGDPISSPTAADAPALGKKLSALLAEQKKPRALIAWRKAGTAPTQRVSHFFGEPYFEKGETWPTHRKTREPLPFVFQIVNDGSLPIAKDIGVLQFFFDERGGTYDTKDPGWAVKIYRRIDARRAMRAPPGPRAQKTPYLVETTPDGSLRSYSEYRYGYPPTRVGTKIGALCEALDPLVAQDAFAAAARAIVRDANSYSFIGGYPRWCQGEGPQRRGYDLVVQIGSVAKAPALMWGDCGVIHLFRHRDTKKLAFVLQSL